MSHYFLLWSGGLDSTFLLNHLLKEGHKVTTGYIKLENNVDQSERELAAINKLQPYFYNKFPDTFSNNGIVLSANVVQPSSNLVLQQASMWTLAWIVTPKECDYIAIGYVMHDCALSYLDDIKNAFNGSSGLVYRNIPVVFPIIKYQKSYMWHELPDSVREHVTWCESVNNNCGYCTSCKRMAYEGIIAPFRIVSDDNYAIDKVDVVISIKENVKPIVNQGYEDDATAEEMQEYLRKMA